MLSRSSRLYTRILGDASPVKLPALLFASFAVFVSPLATAAFALEDAILCGVLFQRQRETCQMNRLLPSGTLADLLSCMSGRGEEKKEGGMLLVNSSSFVSARVFTATTHVRKTWAEKRAVKHEIFKM